VSGAGDGEEGRGITIDDRILARLARAVEDADPIAWGGLAIDRDAAYRLMASQIAEMFRRYEEKGVGRDEQLLIALSSAVKLSVENFVLHQRLIRALGRDEEG
jgi:hypothetical protein